MANEYIPGVCNIGPAEMKARRISGWVSVGLTAALWTVFVAFQTPPVWRLLLFFPASGAATGFLHSAMHFCVGFGMKGVFNFGPQVGKMDSVEQKEFRAQDRKKAYLIILYAAAIGLVVALAGYFL